MPITKALTRLGGCASWSVPVMLKKPEDRFSRVEAYIIELVCIRFWSRRTYGCYLSVLTFVFVAQKNQPIEMVLLSTHNI